MSEGSPSDRVAVEARLRDLRQRLDGYGVHRPVEERSWDELVDLYDAALVDAAGRVGVVVPDRPEAIGRRFTRRQREWLEAQLAAREIHVR